MIAGYSSIAIIGVVLIAGDADNPTYDRPGERFKRIRDQIVENLKDKKLNEDSIHRLRADLAAIDEVLATVNDRRQWLGAVVDMISNNARKVRNQEILQQELEDIAVNELFVKAAALSAAA